jgi:adenylosuccinate synthase
LLNQEIKDGKRILAEDCSSSLMDVDYGIYPYTESFHTTVGSVCSGLGIPDEVIETEVGVMSSVLLVKKEFLNRVSHFPTQIDPETDPVAYKSIMDKLKTRYNISEENYAIGWPDCNLITHSERINKLSSLFLTHLDLLDDLDTIKLATSYKGTDADGEARELKGWMPSTIKELG